jgi:hypothetical protein
MLSPSFVPCSRSGSLEIGRVLRARDMTAGVGRADAAVLGRRNALSMIVGRAKERSDVPAAAQEGGHASLCAPYSPSSFALIFQSPRAFAAIGASASATNRALNLGENASRAPTSRQTNPQTSLSRENLNLSTAQCGHAALLKPRGAGTPRETASDNAG